MTPVSDVEELKAYQDALTQGRLLVRRCNACGEHHHYPRSYCPFCGSSDTGWTEAIGTGEIYSLTVWRRKDHLTVPAFVTLPEGPSVLAIIAGANPQGLKIGGRVRLAAVQENGALPTFTPVT